MSIVFDDPLLDGQLLRVLGSAPYGGCDIGEALGAARRVDPASLDSWHDEWLALGTRVLALAQDPATDRRSARQAFLRAANYIRAAGSMLVGVPLDARLVDSNVKQSEAFGRAVAMLDRPPQVVVIPFEGTTLPGYFFSSEDGPRRTVLLVGGYDSCAEEAYFSNGAAALARGYNVLAFDGPGQGSVLLQQGITMRPDWENVVGPVVDFLLARADVDADRIVLIGLSLGAHLAPRAASGEHRIAALVADCGAFDLYGAFLARLPEQVRAAYVAGDATAVEQVAQMLDQMAAQPTAGWSLRRGMLVHGVCSPHEYIEMTRPYSLSGRAELITCPTFVCNADNDPIGASAPQLVAALTCPNRFVTFTSDEGAGDHCEAGARLLYHARSFGWLESVLV